MWKYSDMSFFLFFVSWSLPDPLCGRLPIVQLPKGEGPRHRVRAQRALRTAQVFLISGRVYPYPPDETGISR